MNKYISALAVVSAFASACLPSYAEEESMTKKVVMMPVRACGVFVGMAVGTPIAIGRMSAKRYHAYASDTSDMEGGDQRFGNVLYAIPMGFGEGVCQGIFYGPKNAITNFDKPFSRESLSLVDSQ